MLLRDANGVSYTAHFFYGQEPSRKRRRTVLCVLHRGSCVLLEPDPLMNPPDRCNAEGRVWVTIPCSLDDQFVKHKGRKIALARAMTALRLPRTVRHSLWADYLPRTREHLTVSPMRERPHESPF